MSAMLISNTEDNEVKIVQLADGTLVDAETGEIIESTDENANKSVFVIDDEGKFEWFMEKLGQKEAEVAALQMRLKVLQENMGLLIKAAQDSRDGFLFRFREQAEAFAKENLKGSKTYRCPFGAAKFRTVNASVGVSDMEKAVAYCESVAPDAVKVDKKVLITKLPKTLSEELIENPDIATDYGFEVRPERETCTIDATPSKDE